MEALYLVGAVLLVSFQDVIKKEYNCREGSTSLVCGFNLIFALVAALFFAAMSGFKLTATWETLVYAVIFGLTFSGAVYFGINMINCGPLSVSTLTVAYSLVIPTATGALLLDEPFGLMAIVGTVLLVLSVLLINLPSKGEKGVGITPKWIGFAAGCFLCNGLCSATQKVFMVKTGGAENYVMTFYAMLIFVVVCAVLFALSKKEHSASAVGRCAPFALLNGAANAVANTLVMLLATAPSAIVYPTISAGSILVSGGVAMIFYKERLSPRQLVGYVLGILAVIALNL